MSQQSTLPKAYRKYVYKGDNMKKKRIKSKNKDIGFISSNGLCIDGDILMSCENEHTSGSYLWFQILLTFAATLCTAFMAASFLDMDIYPHTLIYYSAVLSLVFGLIKSSQKIVRFSALGVVLLHLIYLLGRISTIKYGMFVVIDRYLARANQPNSTLGVHLNGISPVDYTYLASNFFVLLITLVALGVAAACIYRIDFPLLFIVTFPVFELGMYWGWEPSMWTVIGLFICWVTVLAMHIINHTTNKAGRKNTFAVHERKRTFYFTSEKQKACFYNVFMKYTVVLSSAVLCIIMLFSAVTGFTRPESFAKYRHDISTAVANFSLADIKNAFSDYDGGFDLFGIKTVGGTNGGVLGKTAGISFNGSTALRIETPKFKNTLYLRGYVAGVYGDNSWTPLEVSEKDDTFSDDFEQGGLWVQDMDYDLIQRKYPFLTPQKINVSVLGASKKFVYAPYASLYSSDGNEGDKKMRPTTESYVKLTSTKYSLFYFDTASIVEVPESVPEYIAEETPALSVNKDRGVDSYTEFVHDKYMDVSESDELEQAYRTILSEYLGVSVYHKDEWTYEEICSAIRGYFSDNFTYTLEPGVTPEGEDFIEYFLGTQKEGYCSYFATAGAQLLRKFGYPSRYVEGYVVLSSQLGESDSDSVYEVSVKDKCAHAWAEVFIDNAGWYPAEFTPGYNNDNPNLTEQEKDPKSVTATTKSTDSSPAATTKSDGQGGNKTVTTTKPANSSKATTTTKQTNSATSGGHGVAVISGAGKGTVTSSSIAEQNSGYGGSFGGVFITLGGLLLIGFGVVLHRDLRIKKMKSELSEGDNKKRTIAVYSYMLKYLKLIGIADSRNVTDLQLCDKLAEKCKEKEIDDAAELIEQIGRIAVKAYMSNSVITDEELETALDDLAIIRDKIVLSRLSGVDLLTAKFVHCLY